MNNIEMVQELRRLSEKYKNSRLYSNNTNLSIVLENAADRIELLDSEITRLNKQ